jgi:hypothetical protein
MRDISEVGDFARTRKAMNGKQLVMRFINEIEQAGRASYTPMEF